jgi:hypothetical protein
MPPKNNSPDVVRVAQTMPERNRNYLPAAMPNDDASVENVERPRRGHGY